MSEILEFSDRAAFREWLHKNGASSEGVWLLFGKKGGPTTLTATEALEEALCYGWIDGQMQSLGSTKYKKYFARRTANSKWSEKNKALVLELEERGIMTDYGREKIAQAKKNGQWDAPTSPGVSVPQTYEDYPFDEVADDNCKTFTTLFVTGNHSNYELLGQLPVSEWKGGKVQLIRDSVIHLMRGQVYDIDGKRLLDKIGSLANTDKLQEIDQCLRLQLGVA